MVDMQKICNYTMHDIIIIICVDPIERINHAESVTCLCERCMQRFIEDPKVCIRPTQYTLSQRIIQPDLTFYLGSATSRTGDHWCIRQQAGLLNRDGPFLVRRDGPPRGLCGP